MTQKLPVRGSERGSEGCRTGRSQRRMRVTALVVLLLVLILSEYLLLVNDLAVTALSAQLAILLVMDIADRLSVLPASRRP
jgi:succinate dehydrogenase hydrophobic anchor subunit